MKLKKAFCIVAIITLRIITLPIFLISAIAQLIEYAWFWGHVELVKRANSPYWTEATIKSAYTNSWAFGILEETMEDFAEELEEL